MTILRYDGTFEGFLTCVLQSLQEHSADVSIAPVTRSSQLPLEDERQVRTDEDAAAAYSERFIAWCGHEAMHTLALAFLAGDPGREKALLDFIVAARRWKRDVLDHLELPAVREVQRRAQASLAEAHKFKGIIRFRELLDRTFYAPAEPRHHILPLLAGHFAARLPAITWVIHDLGRGLALHHRNGEINLSAICFLPRPDPGQATEHPLVLQEPGSTASLPVVPETPDGQPAMEDLSRRTELLSADEALYQELWKRYYTVIAIRPRTNPVLQMRHLPKRTWKHLIERPGVPFTGAKKGT